MALPPSDVSHPRREILGSKYEQILTDTRSFGGKVSEYRTFATKHRYNSPCVIEGCVDTPGAPVSYAFSKYDVKTHAVPIWRRRVSGAHGYCSEKDTYHQTADDGEDSQEGEDQINGLHSIHGCLSIPLFLACLEQLDVLTWVEGLHELLNLWGWGWPRRIRSRYKSKRSSLPCNFEH